MRLNGSNEITKGGLVPVGVRRNKEFYDQWRCHLSCSWGQSVDVYEYVFEEPQATVHSMDLCILLPFPSENQRYNR